MLTIVWNEKRFIESKSARYAARRCLYRAANSKFNYQNIHKIKHLSAFYSSIECSIKKFVQSK